VTDNDDSMIEDATDGGGEVVALMLDGQSADAGEALIVDVDGFEGPLDLLLALARTQKVDITKISILALAEQYLLFIAEARKLRLELAADYLVMAAWLAYLKSRLLLPEPEHEDGPTGEELAALLAFRLQKLEAMRDAAAKLMARNRLGRDVFERGAPEGVRIHRTSEFADNLYDLLKAYAERRQRQAITRIRFKRLPVWTIKEAREQLERLIGVSTEWGSIDQYLLEYLIEPTMRTTVLASTFSATLEMAREGQLEIRQTEVFAPIFIRRKPAASGQVGSTSQ
jgi:segregation and condensation protein A